MTPQYTGAQSKAKIKGTNPVDINMFIFINDLMERGKEDSVTKIYETMGISTQVASHIANGRNGRKFTVDNIRLLMEKYNGNANFIFGLETEMRRPEKQIV